MASDGRLTHEELLALAELAPLQGLEPEEHRQLARHLEEGCPECANRYAEGFEALDVLAWTTPAVTPTAERRALLLDAIGGDATDRQLASTAGWRVAAPALAAGLALVLATASLFSSLFNADRVEHSAKELVRQARAQLEERLTVPERRIESLSLRLDQFAQTLESNRLASIREFTLAGEASFVGTSARVVVDPSGRQVLLLASELPPAPPGRVYQLWVIVKGSPRSVGVFDADTSGRALHVETGPLEVSDELSVAVSVEPIGGVPQPTGPIVLASQ